MNQQDVARRVDVKAHNVILIPGSEYPIGHSTGFYIRSRSEGSMA